MLRFACGFVFVVSYYYFVGTWMLWGRTIGGVIFDVRVIPEETHAIALRDATMRWGALASICDQANAPVALKPPGVVETTSAWPL